MNKIKRINISDFRIYEGTQEFNFENNGAIANLVVLYAPNGYGKTSFYDAIEWCYSDKIVRINKEADQDSRKDDYALNDNVILTNRASYEKGKKGIVSIETNDFEIKKRVQKWGTRDYRKGEFLKGCNSKELQQLPETNILSQDQIDSFLRHTKAEEKFKQLEKFASQVKDDLEKFKQVDEVYSLLSKQIEKLKEELKNKEIAIGEIKVDESALTSMNDIISEIVKLEGIDFIQLPLTEAISAKELEELEAKLATTTTLLKNQTEQLHVKINTAKELLETFDAYLVVTEDHDKCKKTIASLNGKKKLYTDKTALREVSEKQEKILDDLNKSLKKYKLLLDSVPDAKKTHQGIIDENKSLQSNLTKQQKAKTIIAKLDKRVQELEQNIDKQTRTVSKYQEYIKESEQQAVEQKGYNKHIELNKKKILDVDGKVAPLVQERKELIEKRTLFNEILDNKKWSDFNDYAKEDYILKHELYTQLLLEKNNVVEQQVAKDKELKTSGSLQENLNRIKKWGADFAIQTNISPTDESSCPLCNTSFNTLQLLLAAIDKDRLDALDIPKIEAGIKKLREREVRLQEDISKIEVFFKDSIQKQIQKLIEPIKNKNKELEDFAKLRSGYSLEIKTAKGKIELLERKVSEGISKLNIPENIKTEEYSQYIQEQVESFEQLKTKITHNIERYNSFIDYINIVDANCAIDNGKIRTKIDTLEQNVKYIDFIALLKECNLTFEDVVSPGFKSKHIDVKEKEVEEIGKLVSASERKNQVLVEDIQKHKCEVPEELIAGQIVEEEVRRKELNETLASFKQKVKSISNSEIITIEQLRELITTQVKQNDTLKEAQANIISLTSKTEKVGEQIDKKILEKKRQEIKTKIGKYIDAYDKICGTRKNCVAHIQKGIETTFNKKVINEIYNRIEPHPSLDEIYFRAEIGDNGNPRLVITAKGGGDELNPSLFLSAGQVNVLSLSIFLAKAYEYGSEVISTIFMDDPIQNLSDINILSFIDVLRTLTQHDDKQIVISTHDEKFFRLLQNKMPEEYCNSKFIEFDAPGVVKH